MHRQLESGVVTLDSGTREAHALSPEAAAVWLACDGRKSAHALAAATNLERAAVDDALAALRRANLLDEPAPAGGGLTRRAVLAGGAGVGVALVTSIALPSAAMAASGPPPTTTTTTTGGTTTSSSTSTSTSTTSTSTSTSTTVAPSSTSTPEQSTTTSPPGTGTAPGGSTPGGGSPSGSTPLASASSPAKPSGRLAFTGVNARDEVATALGLVAAGGVIAATARRKTSDDPEAEPGQA